MHDPPSNSNRPLISITPRKKSVRFNITSPSPRNPSQTNTNHHQLNASYTISTTTVNIDHVTNQTHLPYLNRQVEYIPTRRRNQLEIHGEKVHPQTLNELQHFMKTKAENLRRNMTQITTTFNQASDQLNTIKQGKIVVEQLISIDHCDHFF